MSRNQTLSRLLVAAVLAGMLATMTGCVTPDGAYVPDELVVTTAPVYYNGVATYWYGGHWMYRTGGRWGYYDHAAPAGPAVRRYYGGAGYRGAAAPHVYRR